MYSSGRTRVRTNSPIQSSFSWNSASTEKSTIVAPLCRGDSRGRARPPLSRACLSVKDPVSILVNAVLTVNTGVSFHERSLVSDGLEVGPLADWLIGQGLLGRVADLA